MEIVTRPQPRAEPELETKQRIAAVILAAGRSTRMGGPNKLLAEIGGRPLVRIAAEEALASRAKPVIVVTGHQRDKVEAALEGLDVQIVHNPGISPMACRPRSRPAPRPCRNRADGAIVCLGDMPQVRARPDRQTARVPSIRSAARWLSMPVIGGKRGNPVVWSRRFFKELMALEGDVGARNMIAPLRRGGGRGAARRHRGAGRCRHA